MGSRVHMCPIFNGRVWRRKKMERKEGVRSLMAAELELLCQSGAASLEMDGQAWWVNGTRDG